MRLTPRIKTNQRILHWKIDAPGQTSTSLDHFGNTTHQINLNNQHQTLNLHAQGEVELLGYDHGYLPFGPDEPNPLVFSRSTDLTRPNPDIVEFSSLLGHTNISFENRMLELAHAISNRVVYTSGSTTVTHTAADALESGQGVCQDHAHLMLACLRAHGFCARYVSGYRYSEQAPEHASHAWVDVFNPTRQAWLSVNATHRCLADENHCRLAVGKDFTGASPVRGVRSGGGKEKLTVQVNIQRTA